MQAFYFPLFPILGCSLFGSATGISAGTGVSLSAWTKTFQGRETNFCEHGETIRPALFNERSGRHFATWGEFLLSTSSCHHRYVFILPLMSNGLSRLIITLESLTRQILIWNTSRATMYIAFDVREVTSQTARTPLFRLKVDATNVHSLVISSLIRE